MSYSDISKYTDLVGGIPQVKDRSYGEPGVNTNYTRTRGVFSEWPGSTPKYKTNARSRETMARFLIPFSGKNVKDRFDESFSDPETNKLAKSLSFATGNSGGYIDFLLQSAQEIHGEKVQVVDFLSDNFIAYFFGAKPPVFRYTGKLLNTYQDDWRAAFSIMYQEIIRGTKLSRYRKMLTLTYDNVAVSGYVLDMTQILTADMEMAADFTFSMLVKRYDIYRLPDTPPTDPESAPSKAFQVETFGDLKLGVIKRTFRTVGLPTKRTQEREKTKEQPSKDKVEVKEPILSQADLNTEQDIKNHVSTKRKEEDQKLTCEPENGVCGPWGEF